MSSRDQTQFHFVLVHGACHGRWCWYKIADLIEISGHKVTAVDLTSAGSHPADPDSVATVEEYAQPLLDALRALNDTEKVILVGHSFGGIIIGHAAEAFPEKISAAIFVTAAMVSNRTSLSDLQKQMRASNPTLTEELEYGFGKGIDKPPTSMMLPKNLLRGIFYQLSPSNDVTLAKMLVQRHPTFAEDSYVTKYTAEGFGSVPRAYIRAEMDLALSPEIQDLMISQNSPHKVYSLASDHSPFFSTPEKLYQLLLEIASTDFSNDTRV